MMKLDLSSHHKAVDVNKPEPAFKVASTGHMQTTTESRQFLVNERRKRNRRSASDRPGQGRRKGEANYTPIQKKTAFEAVRDAAPVTGPERLVDWDA